MKPTKHNLQQMAVVTATRGGSGHRLMDPAAAARSRPPPVLRCLTWRPVEVSSKICGINCEKFSQSKVQRGHLYQNEPRARLNSKHECSSNMIQPTSSEVTSSQRCLDTFVIVTAHKQVCANQQTHPKNQHKPNQHHGCTQVRGEKVKRRALTLCTQPYSS